MRPVSPEEEQAAEAEEKRAQELFAQAERLRHEALKCQRRARQLSGWTHEDDEQQERIYRTIRDG